jgi:NADH dehydrogenase (ubiquinone) 1 alpha subcomplex subunit 10
MAALASKLGPAALPGLANLAGSSKLLSVGLNNKVQSCSIYSKTSGMLEPRLKPWPYKSLGFNALYHYIDGTTKRFNDNSKMIVVEGPPGLQKTKFAKELAEELDMLFVPGASMDQFYTNGYGYDLRELDHLFHFTKCISYDEKKFAQNPTGQEGGLDRMQDALTHLRVHNYTNALAHLFNTGQGIVTEKSPFTDHVFSEAAYKFGWIDRNSRIFLNKIRKQITAQLLRPNLIIYLDAPVDVVQSKLRERSKTTHPWEKNSPVFENREYLKMVYEDMMKDQYIKTASASSRVLMYDWSEGGDTEVVVEDIERLNMDYFDKYDKQQQDWRMHKEDKYARKRQQYTNRWRTDVHMKVDFFEQDRILFTPEEMIEFQFHAHKVPGSRYQYGYNEELGDSPKWFQMGSKFAQYDNKAVHYGLDPHYIDNMEWADYEQKRNAKRAAGEDKWWQF